MNKRIQGAPTGAPNPGRSETELRRAEVSLVQAECVWYSSASAQAADDVAQALHDLAEAWKAAAIRRLATGNQS